MGKAKQRKMARIKRAEQRLTPTNEQIEQWLKSPEVLAWVNEWVNKTSTKNCSEAKQLECVESLINCLKSDKDNDWRVESQSVELCLGVNALTWTLWGGFSDGKLVFCPDCPFTLQKFISSVEQS